MGKKLNTEVFIERAIEKHKNKYDYSYVKYINAHTKVKIICEKHGEFEQKAFKHLNGEGCARCSGNIKLTLDDFIEKSKKIHGDRFSYEKTNYININSKIIITCKKHGDFTQVASSHLKWEGCYKCSGLKKSNTEEFIEKSKIVHNNKYFYDKVNYKNCEEKIVITCKKHGDFKQTPYQHLKGHGCIKCVGLNKYTTEEFILKANKIHKDKYIYDKVNYVNAYTPVIIECKKHGEFKQAPTHHLDGQNCPVCRSSKGEIKIEEILKENNINYKSQYYFKDLKYKQYLKFDFGILDKNNNIKYLIEYNGIQHYEYVKHIHKDQDNFKLHLYRDKLKQDYCIKNNIPLYIIKYNENIDEKIKQWFGFSI